MPSQISHIPDIHKTTAHITSNIAGHLDVAPQPCQQVPNNKLTEDLEKKTANDKNKTGNEGKEAGAKQNQPRKG
jgi:hypothetical protein